MNRIALFILLVACMLPMVAQRRVTPVETPATMTVSVNETATDTARINAKRRANSITYVDSRGRTMYLDTLTNTEWTDTIPEARVAKMAVPLWDAASFGLNIWDPAMRLFGQEHGLIDAWAELSFHNRYKPIVEIGLGTAKHHAPDESFMYRSPLSFYFRLGLNYNFLFNSNPDYQFLAGVRYGFSPFSFSVDDVEYDDSYWQESGTFNIPSQHVSAGWLEVTFGLRVKLWGPFSAGWSIKYHSILHESKAQYGEPWYIPGYGSRNGALTGSFSIVYTIPLGHLNKPVLDAVTTEDSEGYLPTPADSTAGVGDASADESETTETPL